MEKLGQKRYVTIKTTINACLGLAALVVFMIVLDYFYESSSFSYTAIMLIMSMFLHSEIIRNHTHWQIYQQKKSELLA